MSNHLEPQEKISARRTYTLLQQAFFKLLTEKPFEKITLKELCDTAMIPRSTFYRYFEDKYDLLGYCLQNFFENMDLDIDVIYLKSPAAGRAIGGNSAKTESPCFSRLLRKIQGR